jgi:two-component system, NtrC family, C4-dicarboxylate transport response regulator DctD
VFPKIKEDIMDINRRILFVDDEPLSVTCAMDFLQGAGYDTQCISSEKKAWEVLNKEPAAFRAVILDHNMPGIGGISLLEMIKRSPDLNQIPVIVESDSEDVGSYLTALEAGAFDYLYKPLEKNFLLYVIDNAVNDANSTKIAIG